VLSDLRGEILKDCRALIAQEFKTLIADHEEQTRGAHQRETMAFLIGNMPGADHVEHLPRLMEQANDTHRFVEMLKQEQEHSYIDLEAHIERDHAQWTAFNKEMKEEMENIAAKQNRHCTDDIRKVAEVKDMVNGVKANTDLVVQQAHYLTGVVGQVLANEEIRLALDSQDELDRAEVGLYGLKAGEKGLNSPKKSIRPTSAIGVGNTEKEMKKLDHKRTEPLPEPVVQLHKACLSCAGPTSMIFDLFKVACLAYAPSPVALNGVERPRRYYLDQQRELLASTKEVFRYLKELQVRLAARVDAERDLNARHALQLAFNKLSKPPRAMAVLPSPYTNATMSFDLKSPSTIGGGDYHDKDNLESRNLQSMGQYNADANQDAQMMTHQPTEEQAARLETLMSAPERDARRSRSPSHAHSQRKTREASNRTTTGQLNKDLILAVEPAHTPTPDQT